MRKKRLGEVLRARGHISGEDLFSAIQEQQRKVIHLGELLLERGMVSKKDLASALEEVTHACYIDCESATVDAELLEVIPRAVALRHCVLPLAREGQKIVVAMAQPQNLRVLD